MRFEDLYTPANRQHVLAVCHGILHSLEDAEDAAQDAFVKAWQHLPNFRGASSVATWLHAIARNEALTYLRRQPRVEIVSLDQGMDSSDPSDARTLADLLATAQPSAEWRVFLREVMQVVDGLPPRYALPLRLKVQGYGLEEIGAMMGMASAACIKARVYRAQRQVREKMRRQREGLRCS